MARRPGIAHMKVVVLTGPESTGKSWLAAGLQQQFGGLRVDEYVRWFIEQNPRDTCLADIPEIARGQLQWEDQARAQQPPLLILDTHLLSNMLWSQTLFGACPDWLGGERAITTCTCFFRRNGLNGPMTVSAASRIWHSAWLSSRPRVIGWNSIGNPARSSTATGPSDRSRPSRPLRACWPTDEALDPLFHPVLGEKCPFLKHSPGCRVAVSTLFIALSWHLLRP